MEKLKKIRPRGGIRRSEKGHEPPPETLGGWPRQPVGLWEPSGGWALLSQVCCPAASVGKMKLVSEEETGETGRQTETL